MQALRNWFLSLWRRWFHRPSPSPVVETAAALQFPTGENLAFLGDWGEEEDTQTPPPPANRQQRRAAIRRHEWEEHWTGRNRWAPRSLRRYHWRRWSRRIWRQRDREEAA